MDTTLARESLVRNAIAATQAISEQMNHGVLPIDLREIANSFGCRVEESAIKQQGYIMTTKEGNRIIRIRETDSTRVKRFTLAHELGHIIWRQCVAPIPASSKVFRAKNHSYEERVADRLAAELLMPRGPFEKALRAYSLPSSNALRAIARVFDVSLTACIRRIVELPQYVAFTYVYDVTSVRGRMNVEFRGGYPCRNRLTFVDAPLSLVRKCRRYANMTGRSWQGNVSVQTTGVVFTVPVYSEVAVRRDISTVRISGWLRRENRRLSWTT